MGQIKQIKDALRTRLQPLSDRARIVVDDTEGEAGSASQTQADFTIRVSYTGGDFSPPDTDDVFFELGDRSFQIRIEVKDLRTEDKATELLDDASDLLFGFRACVDGVIGEFRVLGDRFIENRNNIYYYALNVSVPVQIFKSLSNY